MRLQHWFYKLPRRVRSLFRRRQLEIELDEEMQYHIERQIDQNIAKGMTRQEARYAALCAFGNAGVVKESTRDLWRGTFERMIHDFRHALRMIRRVPAFTALAVLTLVIGIGTTTAMFSVVNGVLLKPLGYREPGDLVAISAVSAHVPAAPLSAYYFALW